MSKLFISYSHKDEIIVDKIIDNFYKKGHNIFIDKNTLNTGDPINTELLKNIQKSDFTIIFLSTNSINSKWVRQEIYETLYFELLSKKLKLLPIVIQECDHYNIFKNLKKYDRIYSNYLNDPIKSIDQINNTINKPTSSIFLNENYMRLDIPYPNLEIYMVGDLVGWDANSQLKYHELIDGYLLFGFNKKPHTYFKHFAICDLKESKNIRDKLINSNLNVTGTGDIDPQTNKRRIWFTLKDFSVEGPTRNNIWPEE